MQVRRYPEEDVLLLIRIASSRGGGGGTLRDDFGVIFGTDEGEENVTRVDLHRVSRFLPLAAEREYDAETDTLTLGDNPEVGYRMIDNGDFVSYRQWFDDGSERDVVAIEVRQASEHLAPAIAALL